MQAIQISSSVKLNLTASQWQLYTTMQGVEDVASKMNAEVSEALNQKDVGAAFNVLDKYSSYGASDTEPRWVLQMIVDRMNLNQGELA